MSTVITSPFSIFEPFTGRLSVSLLTRQDHVRNDNDIAKVLHIEPTTIASLWQVHGGEVVRVDAPTSRTVKADAFFTDTPKLTITMRMADCQCFCIYDPEHKVIGLIHAGWKGILAKVIPNSIEFLKREWKSDPKKLIVGAGPSLCAKCSEFSDPMRELPGFPQDLIEGRLANLREAAERQFDEAGVPRANRERMEECTRCNPENYWTYRGGDKSSVVEGWTNVLVCSLTS